MQNNQEKELVLIQELGLLFPTEKSKQRARYGLYRCYCGKEFKSQIAAIKNKATVSCGCYNSLKSAERCKIHGFKNHRLYPTWNGMIQRCNNIKNAAYKNYGGRGITICERWMNVANFIEDMYPIFKEGLSIDRIDNDKGYSKDNCRWADKRTQQQNTRRLQSNNTSGYRGVCWHKHNKKWTAFLKINYKNINLGSFETPLEAAKAYDQYVIDNNLEHTLNGVLT